MQPLVRIPVTPWDTRTPVSARLLCTTTFYDLIHDHVVPLQLCDVHIYAHIAHAIAYAITTSSLMYITHLTHTYNAHRHWHTDKHNMVWCWTAYQCTTRKQPFCAVNFSKCFRKSCITKLVSPVQYLRAESFELVLHSEDWGDSLQVVHFSCTLVA